MMMKKPKEIEGGGQASNRILAGTKMEGEVQSKGDIRVDGELKGTINISGKLVIGEKGKVDGEIKCGSANVSGHLSGTVEVSELLTLQKTARVHGDILTSKLAVEPGAEFTGSCSMGAVVRKMKNEDGGEQPERREEASA